MGMFDEVQRQLRRLERGTSVPVSLPLDAEGFLDRRCPWSECGFTFKVPSDDWREKVPDDIAYCAFCRHEAAPADFTTPEQLAHAKSVALKQVQRSIERRCRPMPARSTDVSRAAASSRCGWT